MNSLQQQIDEAREEVSRLHLESVRCKQAWHIAEELHAGACGRLWQLLEEQKREQIENAERERFQNQFRPVTDLPRPAMTAEQHNAFPKGRY